MTTWPTKNIGDTFERVTEGILPSKYPNKDFRFVGLENIESGTGRLIKMEITRGQLIRSQKTLFKPGETLYGKLRPYLNKVYFAELEGIASTDFWVLRPKQNVILPKLLPLILRQRQIVEKVSATMSGANLPRANKNLFDNIRITLPPLPIQKKIVERLDVIVEAQKANDMLIEKAEELLESFLFQEFIAIGKHWKTQKLKELIEDIKIGPFGSALKIAELSDTGPVRVLFIENIVYNVFEWTKAKYISETKYRELTAYTVQPEDILVTMMGTIGRTSLVPQEIGRAIISSHLIKVTADPRKIAPEFLNLTLRGNPLVTDQIRRKAKGAIMKGLNSTILKGLDIPTPPLDVQKQIITKLSTVQEYKKQLLDQKTKLKELFDSVLEKSMKGELDGNE